MNKRSRIAEEQFLEAERILAKDHSKAMETAETVIVGPRIDAPPPISFRASEPLRAKLDELARQQHRSRGNLIQHILWTYIHEHESKKR